jgi:transcription initiation factor TFIIB
MQDSILCPVCQNNSPIITDDVIGEMICGRCGLVISDRIQEGHPFSIYEINDKKNSTGMPFSLARHDMGLSTLIGMNDRDANGHKLDTSISNKIE